ncbi:MAG: PilT/PilU family type 4a pilus ATPase [Candidatus Omnitrophica bacterium]|nr:PilT/PilU family type 4a pilus ATPase [Candidatus Omnitrophota bacterium]
MKEKFIEKRRYSRIPVTLTIKYCKEDELEPIYKDAISNDISEGGILIQTKESLPVGTPLKLYITSVRLTSPIQISGKVVRVEEVEEGKLYNLGIAFTAIEQKHTDFIKKYIQTVDLDKILNFAVQKRASDIHLVANQPPIMRLYGELIPVHDRALNAEEVKGLIYGFLTERQKEKFEKDLELDTSYINDMGRFRVNVHQEKGQLGAAFRYISTEIKSISELGLPKVVEDLARKPNGLIVVTGPTGSGKSTTLAAMIEQINRERKCMIISLEDPIEYLYQSKKAIIRQREIGFDSHSFIEALKHTLRQDVDVILIGEIRDLDSISIALTAAETGHLVLTTLHTTDAISTVNRIVDVFPSSQQQQIRMQLAETLRGIIAQLLLPRKDKQGLVVANEILVQTPAVANIIRQGNTEQLRTIIQTSTQLGMQTMDSSLLKLITDGAIAYETALPYVKDPTILAKIPKGSV